MVEPFFSCRTGDAEPTISERSTKVGITSGDGGARGDSDSGVRIHSSEVERSHSSLRLVDLGAGHRPGQSTAASRVSSVMSPEQSRARNSARTRKQADGRGRGRRQLDKEVSGRAGMEPKR